MLSDLEVGWLAGFIDGEGNVGIYSHHRESTYQPAVQLRHTHQPTVVYATNLLTDLNVQVLWRAESRPFTHKDSFYARITGMENILRLGRVVAPVSVTKVEQWQVVLAWCESRLDNPSVPYTASQLALANTARTMNRRGKRAA